MFIFGEVKIYLLRAVPVKWYGRDWQNVFLHDEWSGSPKEMKCHREGGASGKKNQCWGGDRSSWEHFVYN